jgi:nondiscriminating glutamyl-tRNA synthetase
MVEEFDIGRIAHSPAVFDIDKLNWLNGQYLRKLSPEEYLKRARPFCQAPDEALLLVWDSLTVLSDLSEQLAFYLQENLDYPKEAVQNIMGDPTAAVALGTLEQHLEQGGELEDIGTWLRTMAKERGYKVKQVLMPVRFALTATSHGPELAKIIHLLGRDGTIKRIRYFLDIARKYSP